MKKIYFTIILIFIINYSEAQRTQFITSSRDTLKNIELIKNKSNVNQLTLIIRGEETTYSASEIHSFSSNDLTIYSIEVDSKYVLVKPIITGYLSLYESIDKKAKDRRAYVKFPDRITEVNYNQINQILENSVKNYTTLQSQYRESKVNDFYSLANKISLINHFTDPNRYVVVKYKRPNEIYIGGGLNINFSNIEVDDDGQRPSSNNLRPTISLLNQFSKYLSWQIGFQMIQLDAQTDDYDLSLEGIALPINLRINLSTLSYRPYINLGLRPFITSNSSITTPPFVKSIDDRAIGVFGGAGLSRKIGGNQLNLELNYHFNTSLTSSDADIGSESKIDFSSFNINLYYLFKL